MSEDIYKRALMSFGRDAQFVVAIEKCSELIRTLTKALRNGPGYDHDIIHDIAQEVGDVQVMLDQLKVYIDEDGVWDNDAILRTKINNLKKLLLDRGD